tara:strand:+ start:56 stop:424 length:369 start_codon:yes stop_codon:yes gene_type:complete
MKYLIFVSFFLFTQNVNANWITFYQDQAFDAKLLLTSVNQVGQKTQALVELKFNEKVTAEGVASHIVFLEHICGGVNPYIIEEKFYRGEANKSEEIYMKNKPKKFENFLLKTFPSLIQQICI